MIVALLLPSSAHAGMLAVFKEKVKTVFLGSSSDELEDEAQAHSMPALKAVVVSDDDTMELLDSASSSSLSATTGSLRMSTEDVDFPANDTISVYEVKKGDTIATVAKLFGVSKNTIMWANDLKSERLAPGDTLLILPITGVRHTVKKGDTVATIARRYKGDSEDIAKYNGISTDASLAVGDVILVPEGEITVSVPRAVTRPAGSVASGYFTRPLVGGRKTQGIHGNNAVDIAAHVGTPIVASADGQVIVARASGYNGGYGTMVIIKHSGSVQTLYAHMNSVSVRSGQTVSKGQVIGSVGNTGRSTGPHLHFEIRGAKNPF